MRRLLRASAIILVAIWLGDIGSADTLPPPITLGAAGFANATPSLAVSGRTVAAVWTASQGGASDVYIATSEDGGATFSAPRRVNDRPGDASANNEQPPRVAISGSGSTRVMTVVWSKRNEGPQRSRRDVIEIAKSADGGRTFSSAKTTHDAAFVGARGWQSLAAAPDGSIHAVWLDGRNADRKIAAMAQTGMMHKGQPPQEVYHGRIASDGRITEHLIASDVCFCCKTTVAIDAKGTVYAAWRHIFPGSLRDIAFAASTDGGAHFTPFMRVSEDKWELNGCPEDGPSMAIDAAGTIHIVWATLVSDGEPQKQVFYATSKDGRTFTPRARVPTTGLTNPGHPQLSITPQGAAIVFDETVDGVRRVSATRVARNGALQASQVLSGNESASHPVVATMSSGDVLVAWTSRAATSGPSAPESWIKLRRIR